MCSLNILHETLLFWCWIAVLDSPQKQLFDRHRFLKLESDCPGSKHRSSEYLIVVMGPKKSKNIKTKGKKVSASSSEPAIAFDQTREVVGEYCRNARGLALRLLEAISESLGLEKDYIDKALGKHGQHMAINYYPPCPQPDLTYGLPGHSDPNVITILLQDDVPGLQVLGNGKWVAVNPIPSTFIVNIGDQIQFVCLPSSTASLPSSVRSVATLSPFSRAFPSSTNIQVLLFLPEPKPNRSVNAGLKLNPNPYPNPHLFTLAIAEAQPNPSSEFKD
nr:protein dmr6-like oxygenase 1 [Quercus suber]